MTKLMLTQTRNIFLLSAHNAFKKMVEICVWYYIKMSSKESGAVGPRSMCFLLHRRKDLADGKIQTV